jgi:two-component system sensor histidine kinase YesM
LKSTSNLSENEKSLLNIEVNNSISNFAYTNKHIHSIEIESPNRNKIVTQVSKLEINQSVRQIVFDLDGYYYWFLDSTEPPNQEYFLSIIRVIKDINKLDSNLALLRINILEDYISEIFEMTKKDSSEQYFLINSNNKIISSRDKSLLSTELAISLPDNPPKDKVPFYTDIRGMKYLITYAGFSNCDWRVVNISSYSELTSSKRIVLNSIFIGLLVGIAFCITTALFFNFKVLSPLKQFKFLMNRIENSDFDIIASEQGNDEFALLGHSFNKMSKKLKELMTEITITANKKKVAELKALEAQINPHFLYNTLDTIYWKARLEKAFETADLVEALSKLFRLSLNGGNEMTTVDTEIENLKKYIFIQKHRYSDLITFKIDVSDEVMKCKVLKLVLQPLVENSIYHGLKATGISGEINIHIYRSENTLIYDISDSGVGVDNQKLNLFLIENEGSERRSIGIKNVHDRIRLYHGKEYGLAFLKVEKGTLVQVKQPFVSEELNYVL